MSEEKIDVTEQIEEMGEKFNKFKKTYVAHIKDHDIEFSSWSFTSKKTDKGYIIDFAGKVEITPKKKK